MGKSVTITEGGRTGAVIYQEGAGRLSFWWEFGGGDVVAIVNVGDEEEWRAKYPWAAGRRAEILAFVAAEVIRQKAPTCRAEIQRECISLRQGTSAPGGPPPLPSSTRGSTRQFDYQKWGSLRRKTATVVFLLTLVVGGLLWMKNTFLVIDPGKGFPIGWTVRTDQHIATFIQTLIPYTPSLNRNHGEDRYRLSLLLVPLDGSETRMVDIEPTPPASAFNLAKVLGSDGRVLWFDVGGVRGVDLKTFKLVRPADARDPIAPAPRWPLTPSIDLHLSAGFQVASNSWLGLHSKQEVEGEFAPRKWLKRIVGADSAKQQRRFYRGDLDPDDTTGYRKILSMTPLGEAEYLNAAFLRMDDKSEPVRLGDPDSALMIYTSAPGRVGTLMVARVDVAGKILWSVDTGLDRFDLQQVLPGKTSMVFVGKRPPVPNTVSEPLLVVVENRTGKVMTHSLLR